MLNLPLDIIENIILSSDTIITTYTTILTLVKTLLSNYDTLSKRKHLNYQHYLSIYVFLSNNTTKLNIYKQSGWYNYFIDIQKHYKNNNNNNNKSITNHLIIDSINKKIIHNLNLIKPIINFDNHNHTHIYNHKYNQYISSIELNINNKNSKLLIQEILLYWKLNITDLGNFILLIIVLLSGNAFKKMNKMTIVNHLYMKFIKEKEDINRTIIMNIHIPCYFNPTNNIIPLFQKSIGMGYTYNIAWDILIKKYIGFLFGGASAEDFYYFDTKLKLYLYKNTNERIDYIKNYKKIININTLIEVLILNDDKTISYYESICVN